MSWFEIAETGEWTKDRDLVEGAMEAGLSVCEFDEDLFQKRLVYFEDKISKLTAVVQLANTEIYELCVQIHNSEHPLQKNASATMITHHLAALRKSFDL